MTDATGPGKKEGAGGKRRKASLLEVSSPWGGGSSMKSLLPSGK